MYYSNLALLAVRARQFSRRPTAKKFRHMYGCPFGSAVRLEGVIDLLGVYAPSRLANELAGR